MPQKMADQRRVSHLLRTGLDRLRKCRACARLGCFLRDASDPGKNISIYKISAVQLRIEVFLRGCQAPWKRDYLAA